MLDSSQMILIFLPIFIIFIIIIPMQNRIRLTAVMNRRKKGIPTMTNELIQKYIGQTCLVSTGSFGQSVLGEITDVVDNWIEVKTKKGNQLLNSDYITNITPTQK